MHWTNHLFRQSGRPAGHGITIGAPRIYELSAGLFHLRGRRGTYRRLLACSGVRPGDHVLDVGSGPGILARLLAAEVGPEGAVVGLDAAPEMTEYATRRARRLGNCRFQAGSADALPFPDDSFDLVTSSLVMHHLPEATRPRAVQEMRRVLRPGGRLLLADFEMNGGHPWHWVARLVGADAMQHRVPPLEPLVAEAGFADLRSGDVPPWLHYVRAVSR